MSQGQARLLLDAIMNPLNRTAQDRQERPKYTIRDFVALTYLPFCLRKWKESTAQTSKQRIEHHLVGDLGSLLLESVGREELQEFLENKAASGLSASIVSHLRWDLRAIFQLAVEDGIVTRNPATSLVTPANASRSVKRVMSREDVVQFLAVLDLRERLISRLAIFAGMRPGEIFGLKWRHIAERNAVIEQRIYRGRVGTPKSHRSVRTAAFTPKIVSEFEEYRTISPSVEPDAWVFPSERQISPLAKDNCWRRHMEPKLKAVGLEWATFQVMRRTHASLSRRAGIDPKVVADQLGHGLGVSLDVYTKSDLQQLSAAVAKLESEVLAA
jgi:integrase